MAYITLKVTKRQLEALMNVTDTISAMIGCGSDFDELDKEVHLVDRMLKNNGRKRNYK